MSYTLINWDELTPINPANLNKMDGEIDSNENRVGTAETNINSNDSDIATLDSRVDGNDSDIATLDSRVDSNDNDIAGNDSDIATLDSRVDSNDNEINQIDGNHDGKVDNADRLNGKRWVTIASGSEYDVANSIAINLKPGGTHNHYNISAFSSQNTIDFGKDESTHYAYITRGRASSEDDELILVGDYSDDTVYYEVWSWE